MATGPKIETRGHIVGFREEISKAASLDTDKEFFTWFDQVDSKESAFIRGAWDFNIHIGAPLSKYISKPEEKIILEVGHGAGRILASASRAFKEAIGVDIHHNNELVNSELESQGISNVSLFCGDGSTIPLEDNVVDVIYSFIVFQHLEKIEIFQSYIAEVYRVLKPGGIAVLYFGRKYKYSINKSSKLRYMLDRALETWRMPKGYEEVQAKVNMTNLRVSLKLAKKIAIEQGLRIEEELVSRKFVPDGTTLYGGQNGLVLSKK